MRRFFLFFSAWAVIVFFVGSAVGGEALKASSFGFDPVNATQCLQKAIDSGAATVVIDNTGKDWIIDPVVLRSGLELVLAENVTVRARPNGYAGLKECMFKANGAKNLLIRGEKNAKIINENDFFNKKKYKHSEWRHTFSIISCEQVTIRDLSLKGSGGDGVYIGAGASEPCRDVTLENLSVEQQGRQGVSVISVSKLRILNCSFNNTCGTNPEAGIDFEPNHPNEVLEDCMVSNCTFNGNRGGGVVCWLPQFDSTTKPVSILVENCRLAGNRNNIRVKRGPSAPKGEIIFRNCQLADPRGSNVLFDFRKDFPVRFENLTIRHGQSAQPVFYISDPAIVAETAGLVRFSDTKIITPDAQTPLVGLFLYPAPVTAQLELQNVTVNGQKTEVFPVWEEFKKKTEGVGGKTRIVNPEELQSPPDGLPAEPQKGRILFRRRIVFLADARKGEKIELQADVAGIGKRDGSYKLEVRDPAGKKISVEQKKISNRRTAISLVPEKAGIFRFEFSRHSKLRITSDHRGQGFTVSKDRFSLVSPRGSLFFEVPAGVTEFKLIAWGEPREILTAALCSPDGKVIKRVKDFDHPEIFTGNASGKKSEVWEFRIERATEDVSVQLLEPLLSIVSERPELLLRHK